MHGWGKKTTKLSFGDETILSVFCPVFFICTDNFAFSLGFQCVSGRGRSTETLHEGCHGGEGREPCGSDPRGTGGGGRTHLHKAVPEDRSDFAVLPSFPDCLPCELEDAFLDSPMGQHYFVTLNTETQRPFRVQGVVLFSYSCVTPRTKFLRLWLVG